VTRKALKRDILVLTPKSRKDMYATEKPLSATFIGVNNSSEMNFLNRTRRPSDVLQLQLPRPALIVLK